MKKPVFHQKTIDEGIAEAEAASKKKQHKIHWLNLPGYKGETWNPIIGCSKVSPGCDNCYAMNMAVRLAHNPLTPDYKRVIGKKAGSEQWEWTRKTRLLPEVLVKPMNWRKPRLVFVCSMGDLFHGSASFEEINAVFSVMADNDQHIYIVLTKRPQRMVEFFEWKAREHGVLWQPKDNVWVGVTAENQKTANQRLPYLNCIYAAVKFVSIEPMLSAISFETALGNTLKWHAGGLKNCLSWVIVGGESGHNARPMHPFWIDKIYNQCKNDGIPFFFKQWGEYRYSNNKDSAPAKNWKWVSESGHIEKSTLTEPFEKEKEHHALMIKVGRKQAGNLLDGEVYQQYPKL